jgi:hypothetical protein
VQGIPIPVVALLAASILGTNLTVLEVDREPPVTIAIADAPRTGPDLATTATDPATSDPTRDRSRSTVDRSAIHAMRLRGQAGAWQAQQAAADLRTRRDAAAADAAAADTGDTDPLARATAEAGHLGGSDQTDGSAPTSASPSRTAPAPRSTPEPAATARPSPDPAPSPVAEPEPAATPAPAPSPTASAAPAPAPDPGCDQRCRGERLYEALHVEAPSNWTVRFEDEHPQYLGLADSRTRTITIHMRESMPDRVMSWTMYHEVGHSHDFTFLNTAERDRWARSRGYAGRAWFGCNYCSDYETPVGDWAESFAYCHTGWDDQWRSKMGTTPTAGQCDLLHELRRP